MLTLLFNVSFMVLFWIWAIESFELADNKRGWFYLFMSAFSGAAILSSLF